MKVAVKVIRALALVWLGTGAEGALTPNSDAAEWDAAVAADDGGYFAVANFDGALEGLMGRVQFYQANSSAPTLIRANVTGLLAGQLSDFGWGIHELPFERRGVHADECGYESTGQLYDPLNISWCTGSWLCHLPALHHQTQCFADDALSMHTAKPVSLFDDDAQAMINWQCYLNLITGECKDDHLACASGDLQGKHGTVGFATEISHFKDRGLSLIGAHSVAERSLVLYHDVTTFCARITAPLGSWLSEAVAVWEPDDDGDDGDDLLKGHVTLKQFGNWTQTSIVLSKGTLKKLTVLNPRAE